jgi:hypothetical protein
MTITSLTPLASVAQRGEIVALRPGQSLRTGVDAGTRLQVLEGRVRLASPPAWLGDMPLAPGRVFDAGEVLRPEQGGWIELVALSAARVYVPQQAPAAALAASPVMRLVQLLTGR